VISVSLVLRRERLPFASARFSDKVSAGAGRISSTALPATMMAAGCFVVSTSWTSLKKLRAAQRKDTCLIETIQVGQPHCRRYTIHVHLTLMESP